MLGIVDSLELFALRSFCSGVLQQMHRLSREAIATTAIGLLLAYF